MVNPHTSNSSPAPLDRPCHVGKQLRQAREASRLSVVSAAATLRLHPKIILALEADDFQQFEPVYVRGYLRNYARLLDLAVEPLLDDYNRSLAPPPAPEPVPAPPAAAQPRLRKHLRTALAIGLLPLLLWGVARTFQPSRPAPDATPPDVVAHVPAEPPVRVETPPPAAAPAVATTSQPLALPALPAEPPPPPPPAPPQPSIHTAVDHILLRLSASGWVSIRDHDGKRLLYETVPAASERRVEGQAPFTVVLGNAPATQLEFNGQPYPLPSAKTGTVARFTLGMTDAPPH